MIKLENVSFAYGNIPALKNVNISETEPIIMGLWGRNGAGKTTLMKLLAGLEKPKNGVIDIHGISPYNHSEGMKYIAYMQENHPFSEFWNVKDALMFGAYFNPNWDQQYAEELVELFELPKKKLIRKFSKGMQTMIKIVIGLASKAPVTIMDEPTNGLDAFRRKQFYDVLLETYEDHPRLFILSSHHIEEIEPLCEKIAVIHNKTLASYTDTEELKRRGLMLTGPVEEVQKLVQSHHQILQQKKLRNQMQVMIDDVITDEWHTIANANNVRLENVSLQDYLVHKTMTQEGRD